MYISVYKCGSHQEAAALERKESEKKKHTRSDKDLIVGTGVEEPLRPVGAGRANRIEQIATLSKLSERADRSLREECATRLLRSG